MTFGPETYDRQSPYAGDNVGQEVIVYFNSANAYGILESVSDGAIKLNPCLVNQPDRTGDMKYKLMDRPGVFPVQGAVVLPVDMGTIDTILEDQEKRLKEGDENGC